MYWLPSAHTCVDVPTPVPRPVWMLLPQSPDLYDVPTPVPSPLWGHCYVQCSIHLIAKDGGGSLLVGSRALATPPPPPQGVRGLKKQVDTLKSTIEKEQEKASDLEIKSK